MAGKVPCPRYTLEMEKVRTSKEIEDLNKKYQSMYDYITLHSGRNIQNFSEVEFIYDVLLIEVSD